MTLTIMYLVVGLGYLAHGAVGLIHRHLRSPASRRFCIAVEHQVSLYLGGACCCLAAAYSWH